LLQGANFVPALEVCDPVLLESKTVELLDLSVELIKADVRQPHGYDIHLAISLIYFRISERNENDYTRAEMIARQFFEVQKASSRGRALNTARYYWTHFSAAHGSYQYFNNPTQLNNEKKEYFVLVISEGTKAVPQTEGARLVRLKQALELLQLLSNFIE